MDAQSLNELQWLNFKIGHMISSPSIRHQGLETWAFDQYFECNKSSFYWGLLRVSEMITYISYFHTLHHRSTPLETVYPLP